MTSSLGCLAFLAGGAGALALLAPFLLAPSFARMLEDELAAVLPGEVAVGGLALRWSAPQELRGLELHDPGGGRVLLADLQLPSLLELARSARGGEGRARSCAYTLTLRDLDLESDAQGCNLGRALGAGTAGGIERTAARLAELCERLGVLPPRESELRVVVRGAGELAWTDRRGEPARTRFELRDVWWGLRGRAPGAREAFAAGRIELAGDTPGRLDFDLAAPWPASGGLAPRGELRGRGLPAELLARLWGSDTELAPCLGTVLDLDLAFAAEAETTRVEAALEGTRGFVRMVASLAGGRLVASGAGAPSGELTLPPQWMEGALLTALGEATGVRPALAFERERPGARWLLEGERLELGLPWPLLGAPAETPGRFTARWRLVAPGELLVWDERAPDAPRVRLRPRTIALAVERPGSDALELALDVLEEGRAGGALELRVHGPRFAHAWLPRRPSPPFALSAHGHGLPARLLDALLARQELFVTALGPEVALALEAPELASWSDPFDLLLSAGEARARFVGRLDGGAFVFDGEGAIEARLRASAPVLEGLVRPLLPWLIGLEPTAPDALLSIAASRVRLPLAPGRPGAIAAELELDLGELRFRYPAGIARIAGAGAESEVVARLPLARLHLAGGELHYEELSLPLGELVCGFEGTLDLEDGTIELETRLPLSLVPGAEPRGVAGAQWGGSIPLAIGGTWRDPRPTLEVGVLPALLQALGSGEVREDLRALLERLLPGELRAPPAEGAAGDG